MSPLSLPPLPLSRLRPRRAPALLAALGLVLSSAALAQGWVDPPVRGTASPAPATAPSPEPAPAARAEAPAAPKAHAAPRRVAEEAGRPARSGLHAATEARRAARLAHGERAPTDRAHAERPPLPVSIPARPPVAASDGQMRDWAVASQRLARDYLASVSGSNGAALAAAPGFYGNQVVFHGRTMTVARLMSEKRRFVQRWPERRYRPRPDSLRTACNAGLAVCRVQATVDFSASSPDRGARSQGTVDLELTVSLAGSRPVIIAETSRVVSRAAVASRD